MLARNSLLARLADSAASLARCNSASLAQSFMVRSTTLRSTAALVASNWAVRRAIFSQLPRALNAGSDEEYVFEHDPAGMLEPAPSGGQHSEDRLRPEHASKKWSAATTTVAVMRTCQSR